jgi:hypothetical protein
MTCSKNDEPTLPKTSHFQINVNGYEPLTFFNNECYFNQFSKNQYHLNFPGTIGYHMNSVYWFYTADSVLNKISFVFLLTKGHAIEPFSNLDSLASFIAVERNSNTNEHLKLQVTLYIDGRQFHNRFYSLFHPGSPAGEIFDDLYYEIEDYEVYYYSECLKKDLLYVKIRMEGKLYEYETPEWDDPILIDSIYINSSEMQLLFAVD